jgi:hypothetical protein
MIGGAARFSIRETTMTDNSNSPQVPEDAAEGILGKAKAFLDKSKDAITDAVTSDKVEDVSDKVLGGVADAVKNATGGKFDAQVDAVRDTVDKRVGNDQ